MTTLSISDVTVPANATEARLVLSLDGPITQSVFGKYATRNAIGATAPLNYAAANWYFAFHPGSPLSKELIIPLRGNNVKGWTIEVVLSGLVINGTLVPDNVGKITIGPALALTYETDFVTNFTVNDTGLVGSVPCWQSRFNWDPVTGRMQNGNAELGLYVDPVVHPGTNPFPIVSGKRRLRSEKLSTPITWGGQQWNYTASIMTSWKLPPIVPGSRIECKFSLPSVGKRGAWPAFWLLPSSGARWPEMDLLEKPERDDANPFLYFITQHDTQARPGKWIDTRTFGVSTDLTQTHTYAVDVGLDYIRNYFDGIEVMRMVNGNPGNNWYIILDMAMGGTWPGNPGPDSQFPVDMILENLKIYSPV